MVFIMEVVQCKIYVHYEIRTNLPALILMVALGWVV